MASKRAHLLPILGIGIPQRQVRIDGRIFEKFIITSPQRGIVHLLVSDEEGHQLPNYENPGLKRQEIVRAVEDFYAHYYFRPRIIFRIVSLSLFSGSDRRRLYEEAKAFFKFRVKRKCVIHISELEIIGKSSRGTSLCSKH